MLGALRRGSASLSRHLSSLTLSPKTIRAPFPLSSASIRVSSPRVPLIATATFHQTATWRQVAAAQVDEIQSEQDGPVTQFKDLALRGLVHPNVINIITKQMKLETMTDVQSRTINEALSGVDVIAQAKTGTGKTLGFLIPVIQRIIQMDPKLGQQAKGYKRARPDDIRAIIISPTRELAEQIAVEAKKITSGTSLVVQIAVGGTQKREMLRKTQREGCHILIGTPGRLVDVFSDQYSGVKAPKLDAFVLDEADRLMDQGFTEEIDKIKQHLPDPDQHPRQTLMFSATVARDVVDLVRRTLKPGFHFAKCVNDDELPTHERVIQKLVRVKGFENLMPTLYELFLKAYAQSQSDGARPFKAIVYFNSTAEVTLAASVFYKLTGGHRGNKPLRGLRGYEIHSRLTQAQRTRASDDFRFCKSGVLFSSDVTARGMDFPNVTHIIQVGVPRDHESYVHRLGRTARAGKEGEGWLLATPFDREGVHRRLRGLPLQPDTSLETASVDMSEQAELPENVARIFEEVVEAHSTVPPATVDAAFKGLFGSYQGYDDKHGLLEGANRLAEFGWGMSTPPAPPASLFSGGRRGGGGGRGGDRRGSNRGFGGRSSGFDDKWDEGRSRGYSGDRQGGGRSGGFGGDRQSGGRYEEYGGDRRSGGRSGGFGGNRDGGRGGDRRRPGGDRRASQFSF